MENIETETNKYLDDLLTQSENIRTIRRSSILKLCDYNTEMIREERRASKRVSFAKVTLCQEVFPDGTITRLEKELKVHKKEIDENIGGNDIKSVNFDSNLSSPSKGLKCDTQNVSKVINVEKKKRISQTYRQQLEKNYDIDDEKDYDTIFNTSVNRYGREIAKRTEKPKINELFVFNENDYKAKDELTTIITRSMIFSQDSEKNDKTECFQRSMSLIEPSICNTEKTIHFKEDSMQVATDGSNITHSECLSSQEIDDQENFENNEFSVMDTSVFIDDCDLDNESYDGNLVKEENVKNNSLKISENLSSNGEIEKQHEKTVEHKDLNHLSFVKEIVNINEINNATNVVELNNTSGGKQETIDRVTDMIIDETASFSFQESIDSNEDKSLIETIEMDCGDEKTKQISNIITSDVIEKEENVSIVNNVQPVTHQPVMVSINDFNKKDEHLLNVDELQKVSIVSMLPKIEIPKSFISSKKQSNLLKFFNEPKKVDHFLSTNSSTNLNINSGRLGRMRFSLRENEPSIRFESDNDKEKSLLIDLPENKSISPINKSDDKIKTIEIKSKSPKIPILKPKLKGISKGLNIETLIAKKKAEMAIKSNENATNNNCSNLKSKIPVTFEKANKSIEKSKSVSIVSEQEETETSPSQNEIEPQVSSTQSEEIFTQESIDSNSTNDNQNEVINEEINNNYAHSKRNRLSTISERTESLDDKTRTFRKFSSVSSASTMSPIKRKLSNSTQDHCKRSKDCTLSDNTMNNLMSSFLNETLSDETLNNTTLNQDVFDITINPNYDNGEDYELNNYEECIAMEMTFRHSMINSESPPSFKEDDTLYILATALDNTFCDSFNSPDITLKECTQAEPIELHYEQQIKQLKENNWFKNNYISIKCERDDLLIIDYMNSAYRLEVSFEKTSLNDHFYKIKDLKIAKEWKNEINKNYGIDIKKGRFCLLTPKCRYLMLPIDYMVSNYLTNENKNELLSKYPTTEHLVTLLSEISMKMLDSQNLLLDLFDLKLNVNFSYAFKEGRFLFTFQMPSLIKQAYIKLSIDVTKYPYEKISPVICTHKSVKIFYQDSVLQRLIKDVKKIELNTSYIKSVVKYANEFMEQVKRHYGKQLLLSYVESLKRK